MLRGAPSPCLFIITAHSGLTSSWHPCMPCRLRGPDNYHLSKHPSTNEWSEVVDRTSKCASLPSRDDLETLSWALSLIDPGQNLARVATLISFLITHLLLFLFSLLCLTSLSSSNLSQGYFPNKLVTRFQSCLGGCFFGEPKLWWLFSRKQSCL